MVQALLNEVESCHSFFSSRAPNDPGNDILKKNFANSLIQQINQHISLNKAEATQLTEALKASPFDAGTSKQIMAAVDAKVLASSAASQSAIRITEQFLKEWWAFCTQKDWDFFYDPKISFHAKMAKLVERANLLGLTHPGQQAEKWMLAMLLMVHYTELPSPRDIYEKLQELKQVIVSERRPFPIELPHMTAYPSTPKELPEDIYTYAYADGEPILVELPGIFSIAEHKIPLKSNNKLLNVDVRRSRSSTSPAMIKQSPKVELKDEAEAADVAPVSNAEVSAFAADMPTKGDRVEERLYATYKAGLWKHRAEKQGLLGCNASCSSQGFQPVQADGTVPFKTEQDGSVTLRSRLQLGKYGAIKKEKENEDETAAVPAKKDDEGTAGAAAGETKKEDYDDGREEELDEFAKAAISALGKRNTARKHQMKRPAAADAPDKENAKKVKKEDIEIIPKARIAQSMPKDTAGGNPAPIHYGGGVVYTVKKKFRALRVRGDVHSEKSFSWGSTRTKKEAWMEAIKAIDEHDTKLANEKKKGKAK